MPRGLYAYVGKGKDPLPLRANAIIKGGESSLGTLAHSDHHLLVGDAGTVACGIDTCYGATTVVVDDDLAHAVALD